MVVSSVVLLIDSSYSFLAYGPYIGMQGLIFADGMILALLSYLFTLGILLVSGTMVFMSIRKSQMNSLTMKMDGNR